MAINVGDDRRIKVAFTASDVAADPTTIKIKYQHFGGDVVTETYDGTEDPVVKDSTGNYHIWVTLTTAGRFNYRWEGTGTVPEVEEGAFQVEENNID